MLHAHQHWCCMSKSLQAKQQVIGNYRKSALFRHFLAVFSLYRELCDLHKVDCAWIRTL